MTALENFDLTPFATGAPLPSPEATATAVAIDETLQSTGFLLVSGHGVSDAVRATYFDAMQLMFLYMGFSYMMSVFGGWLGDSVLGMCAEGWICDGASLMFGALLNQQY